MDGQVVKKGLYEEVVVHPLVLLSVVDHFRRVEEDDTESKRVIGVLLGEARKGRLDVTSSFAGAFRARLPRLDPRRGPSSSLVVSDLGSRTPSLSSRPATDARRFPTPSPHTRAVPFEEDENDPSIWFLDHSYLEKMCGMFRRINGPRPPSASILRSGGRAGGGIASRRRADHPSPPTLCSVVPILCC